MVKKFFLILLSIFMIFAGINHFRDPNFYLKMMPPYLPFHTELNYLSGLFEVLCGVLLLIPKTKVLGAWLCIATFIAVYPANIYMAQNPNLFPDLPEKVLYIRLPIQFLFIYWAYLFTKKKNE